ncbi:MAG: hypothetical protein INR71_06130 [Terriglobus roseus]|nr:hypothetical protein [Terriglobus roseus]
MYDASTLAVTPIRARSHDTTMPSAGGHSKSKASRDRRSRSRNTTPVSSIANIDSPVPNYLQHSLLSLEASQTLDDVLGSTQSIPQSANLSSMLEQIRFINSSITAKNVKFDLLMRDLSKIQREREQEDHQRMRERERQAQEADRKKERAERARKGSPAVVPKKREREEERPPAIGAHGVARQDGAPTDQDNSSDISSPAPSPPPSANGSAGADRQKTPGSPDSDASPVQPPPAPTVAQYHLFGEDPNTFPDDTVYHIRQVTPGMTDEEKMEIYHVRSFPHDDLVALTVGVLPDKDFSQGKDNKQTVSAQQFANHVEPFIRPLNDEDVAFLRERQDRVGVMEVPPKGRKHYKDIWAEEDGQMNTDNLFSTDLPPNQARGAMDDMDDFAAESDQISNGPAVNRMVQLLRLNPRQSSNGANAETNGDTAMTNGVGAGEHDEGDGATNGDTSHQPATFLPDTRSEIWKNAPAQLLPDPNPDMDTRILAELKWLGFMPEDAVGENKLPPYDNAEDDEVAARLRYLQEELKEQAVVNGARKERVLELTGERTAMQEYMTIADDLDNQLNQAYLKRNRNLGKGKKNVKKPGMPGVAEPVGRPAMGEPIRSLLDRRHKWKDWIGPTVDYGLGRIPKHSVFSKAVMASLEKKEREDWERAAEEAEV